MADVLIERIEKALMQMLYDRAAQKPDAPTVHEMAERLTAVHGRNEREHEAVFRFLKVARDYPPEITDGRAWRLGGAARDAWQETIRQLREAHDA